ncbi:hypothetical protein [Luteipulveratus mongoliensis]|uniref:hypothetical protein n=1 Tax=Luteipulveratus mongoliensis TaxID=571913 RepID=UPI000696C126|nr:hypothetical protein [Luteipulveratus mongoliensis]
MRLVRLAVVLLCGGTLVSGCADRSADPPEATVTVTAKPSSTPPEYSPPPVPLGRKGTPRGAVKLPAVDLQSPASVCNAYVLTSRTSDTRLDNSRNDAQRRASQWLAAELRMTIATPIGGSPGADWRQLKAHDGYTTATAEFVDDEGSLPSSATERSCVLLTTVTRHQANGAALGPPEQFMITVTVVRETGVWKVQKEMVE